MDVKAAIFILPLEFRSNRDVPRILKSHAADNPDVEVRNQALVSLAFNFVGDPETTDFFKIRALHDVDSSCRRAALRAFSRSMGEEAAALASAGGPDHDPLEPITAEAILETATKLKLTPEAIRAFYARLSAEIPLIFA